jgi:predicted MFS family arabinose efflux permease
MSTQLWLLGAAGFISVGAFRISDPLLPKIAEDFATSVGGAAVSVTAFSFGYAIFQLLNGPLGDRLGKLRVIRGALVLTSIAIAACALSDSLNALIALRFITGMTAGAIAPLAMAHIGDTVAYEGRQPVIGRFLMACLIGQMMAGSLAGIFAEYFGWRFAFVAFGVLGLAIAACLWRPASRAAPPTHTGAGARTTHFEMLRDAQARNIWTAAFFEGFLTMGAVTYAGAFLKLEFALDYATIGLVLASMGVGGIFYTLNVGWLLQRLGERGMVVSGGVLVTAGYGMVAVSPVWQWLVPALGFIGLGFYLMHGILQVRATEIAPRARGTALGGFVFYLLLGEGAGVFVLSYVIDGPGYRAAFGITTAAIVVFALWLYRALFGAHAAKMPG